MGYIVLLSEKIPTYRLNTMSLCSSNRTSSLSFYGETFGVLIYISFYAQIIKIRIETCLGTWLSPEP